MASEGVSTLILLLLGFWIIAIFIIILMSVTETNAPAPSDGPVHIPGLGPCEPLESLVDVSEDLCCVSGGLMTALRYSPELDAVVGPSATIWTQACNTLLDVDQIEECLVTLHPNACNSKAAAIAKIGIERYYVRNFGDGGCTTTAAC